MKYSTMIPNHVSKLIPYEPGKPIEEVQRELGIKRVIKLASNENTLGPSPKAVEAIRKYANKVNYYPEGSAYYLREKIASKLNIGMENIVIGNGTTELVELIAKALLEEKDHSVISKQTFIMYKIALQILNRKYTAVSLKNYKYDLGDIKRAIQDDTKLIFIANPNNPTGTYVSKGELDDFIRDLPSHVILILDEAYYEYVCKEDYPNGIDYFNKGYPVIILRTFSKVHGLAGMRVGYAIADKEIIDSINKVRSPFNTSSISQVAATAALDDIEHVQKSIELNLKERDFLYNELKKLGFTVLESSANFIWFESAIPQKELYDSLLKKGIIIRPLKAFEFDNAFRVTVSTHNDNLLLIEKLAEIIKKYK